MWLIYSPGEFTEMAERHGFRPGFAVDLQTGWDLEEMEHVKILEETQEKDPYIVIGSPPCEAFSQLLHISKSRRDPKVIAAMMARGVRHLERSVAAYRRQMHRGRYSMHRHPRSAESWQERCIVDLEADESVV